MARQGRHILDNFINGRRIYCTLLLYLCGPELSEKAHSHPGKLGKRVQSRQSYFWPTFVHTI